MTEGGNAFVGNTCRSNMQRGRARQGKFRRRFARETGQSGGGWWIVVMRGPKEKGPLLFAACPLRAPRRNLRAGRQRGSTTDTRPDPV